ncbi:MAG TPA: GNAT family N-acetyltransferase [Candidatus Eremiobacteraceae bacterium]|nr:GNAT family N-acetyltransferase [Candidatus Eremiobacteraceae bacterium]
MSATSQQYLNLTDRLAASPALEVKIARSLAEVAEIREIWSSWPSHRDSDIDFCLGFVWADERVIRPHVILIYRDGRPEAMLVGRLEHTRLRSKIGYLNLAGISSRALIFAYGSLLGDASVQNCNDFMQSVLSALRDGEADLALFDHLRVGSFLHERALVASGVATRDHLATAETHFVMSLPGDIKDVYAGLSGNHRSDLKRKAKKLMADHQGSVKVLCYREPSELEGWMQQVEEIAKKTYQRGLGVGFQNDEETRRRLLLCAEKGWLRAYILHVGGTPCAFWIGTVYHGRFCSDYLAFDPAFSQYSPGTFLLMKVVEEFCAEGVKGIDFGFGEARYKEQFGNNPLTESSVFLFSPTPKGILLNATRTSAGLMDKAAKKLLEGTNLLPRIKKVWRARSSKLNT